MTLLKPLGRSFLTLFAAMFLLGTPTRALAQIRPGIERGDYWGDVRAKYRGEVLEGVGKLMDAWVAAWNRWDVDAMVGPFTEDGVLILSGVSLRGAESMRAMLAERTGPEIVQSLSDFDVRGDMAFATARLRVASDADGGSPAAGFAVWTFLKEGGGWRIRSLLVDLGS